MTVRDNVFGSRNLRLTGIIIFAVSVGHPPIAAADEYATLEGLTVGETYMFLATGGNGPRAAG